MPSCSAFILMADDLMLGDSGLSKLEREMIAVAVSSVNHCHYCLTSHGAAVRQRGDDPELGELMAQNYRAADLPAAPEGDARLRRQADRGSPTRSRRPTDRALRQGGFTDRDIWDIAAVAAFYNMTNRMAAAADMRPNREYHYMVRRAHRCERTRHLARRLRKATADESGGGAAKARAKPVDER